MDNHTDADVLQIIKNTRGIQAGLHVNDQALETMLQAPINELRFPVVECAEKVYDALVDMAANKVDCASLKRYKNLKLSIDEHMT